VRCAHGAVLISYGNLRPTTSNHSSDVQEDHPSTFPLPPFFFDTSALLSRIYRLVETQIRSLSPLPVQAACAWILDRVSQDWVNKAEGWLGVREAESEEDWRSWECVGAIWIQGSQDYKARGLPSWDELDSKLTLLSVPLDSSIQPACRPLCRSRPLGSCSMPAWPFAYCAPPSLTIHCARPSSVETAPSGSGMTPRSIRASSACTIFFCHTLR
jgi:hypothetical protein